MGLAHAVVTAVARDDLADGGAAGVRRDHRGPSAGARPASRSRCSSPTARATPTRSTTIFDARPDVLNHNLETVARLQRAVRPSAGYARSLAVLARAKAAGLTTKSGLIVGLGETERRGGRRPGRPARRSASTSSPSASTCGPTSAPPARWPAGGRPTSSTALAEAGEAMGIGHVEAVAAHPLELPRPPGRRRPRGPGRHGDGLTAVASSGVERRRARAPRPPAGGARWSRSPARCTSPRVPRRLRRRSGFGPSPVSTRQRRRRARRRRPTSRSRGSVIGPGARRGGRRRPSRCSTRRSSSPRSTYGWTPDRRGHDLRGPHRRAPPASSIRILGPEPDGLGAGHRAAARGHRAAAPRGPAALRRAAVARPARRPDGRRLAPGRPAARVPGRRPHRRLDARPASTPPRSACSPSCTGACRCAPTSAPGRGADDELDAAEERLRVREACSTATGLTDAGPGRAGGGRGGHRPADARRRSTAAGRRPGPAARRADAVGYGDPRRRRLPAVGPPRAGRRPQPLTGLGPWVAAPTPSTPATAEWIARQPVFFVATAPSATTVT